MPNVKMVFILECQHNQKFQQYNPFIIVNRSETFSLSFKCSHFKSTSKKPKPNKKSTSQLMFLKKKKKKKVEYFKKSLNYKYSGITSLHYESEQTLHLEIISIFSSVIYLFKIFYIKSD